MLWRSTMLHIETQSKHIILKIKIYRVIIIKEWEASQIVAEAKSELIIIQKEKYMGTSVGIMAIIKMQEKVEKRTNIKDT